MVNQKLLFAIIGVLSISLIIIPILVSIRPTTTIENLPKSEQIKVKAEAAKIIKKETNKKRIDNFSAIGDTLYNYLVEPFNASLSTILTEDFVQIFTMISDSNNIINNILLESGNNGIPTVSDQNIQNIIRELKEQLVKDPQNSTLNLSVPNGLQNSPFSFVYEYESNKFQLPLISNFNKYLIKIFQLIISLSKDEINSKSSEDIQNDFLLFPTTFNNIFVILEAYIYFFNQLDFIRGPTALRYQFEKLFSPDAQKKKDQLDEIDYDFYFNLYITLNKFGYYIEELSYNENELKIYAHHYLPSAMIDTDSNTNKPFTPFYEYTTVDLDQHYENRKTKFQNVVESILANTYEYPDITTDREKAIADAEKAVIRTKQILTLAKTEKAASAEIAAVEGMKEKAEIHVSKLKKDQNSTLFKTGYNKPRMKYDISEGKKIDGYLIDPLYWQFFSDEKYRFGNLNSIKDENDENYERYNSDQIKLFNQDFYKGYLTQGRKVAYVKDGVKYKIEKNDSNIYNIDNCLNQTSIYAGDFLKDRLNFMFDDDILVIGPVAIRSTQKDGLKDINPKIAKLFNSKTDDKLSFVKFFKNLCDYKSIKESTLKLKNPQYYLINGFTINFLEKPDSNDLWYSLIFSNDYSYILPDKYFGETLIFRDNNVLKVGAGLMNLPKSLIYNTELSLNNKFNSIKMFANLINLMFSNFKVPNFDNKSIPQQITTISQAIKNTKDATDKIKKLLA